MGTKGLLLALLAAPLALADISDCLCDPAEPKSMELRSCSLSLEAVRQPAGVVTFFVKDVNPSKPNRWLALPGNPRKGVYRLADLTPQERLRLWTDAIRKAKELWGDQWGLAYNGDFVRTQCHPHVHIGKLIPGIETDEFVVVSGPAEIPLPPNDEGIWIHPLGEKLHFHTGDELTEPVLLR